MSYKVILQSLARNPNPINLNDLKIATNFYKSCPFGETRQRLGPNLKKAIVKEYNGDSTKISKFAKMFDTIFSDFDADTVFEIGKNKEFLLYKTKNPNLTTECGNFGKNAENIAGRIISFCTNALHAGENWLKKQA